MTVSVLLASKLSWLKWRPHGLSARADRMSEQANRLRARADRLRDDAEWVAAAALYADYLEKQPSHSAIWVQRGNCLKEAGQFDLAMISYGRAEQLSPQDADVQLQLGHLNKLRGDSKAALERYRRAVQFDPYNEDALKEVDALAPAPQASSAAWAAGADDKWLDDQPGHLSLAGRIRRPRGADYDDAGARVPEAVHDLIAQVAANPEDGKAWIDLKARLAAEPAAHWMAPTVQSALSKAPNRTARHVELAQLLMQAGSSPMAREVLRTAYRAEPRLAIAQALGRLGAPREYLEKATRPSPRTSEVFLEITDLLDVIRERATVTGIQRVQCGLVDAVLKMPSEQIGRAPSFVIWQDRQLWSLQPESLRAILDHIDASGASDLDGRRRLVQQARDGSLLVQPQLGDTVVSTGVAYLVPDIAICGQALKRVGVRLGAIIHDFIPLTHPELANSTITREFGMAISDIVVQLDFALPNSEFTGREMQRLLESGGYAPIPSRVTTLAHTLRSDSEYLSSGWKPSWRGAIASLKGREFVLCVGTFAAHKNQELLFNVWRLLIARGTVPPLLVLVGHKAHGVDELFRQMEATRYLDGRIAVLEGLDDEQIRTLYASCLFTVFPSKVEGWGLPVGESLWHGKVCVASDVASIPEVGGRFAIYIDPYNARGSADVIGDLLEDRERLRFLERRITSHFKGRTWTDYANDLVRAIDELTETELADQHCHRGAVALKEGTVLKVRSAAYDWEFGARLPPRELQEAKVLRKVLLVSGWRRPETWGVWMSDPKARLSLSTNLEPGTRVVVALQLRAAAWARDNQIVVRSSCGAVKMVPLPPAWSNEAQRSIPRNGVALIDCAVSQIGTVDLTLDVLGAPAPSWWGEPRTLVLGLVRLMFLRAEAASIGLEPNLFSKADFHSAGARPRLLSSGGSTFELFMRGQITLVRGWGHTEGGNPCVVGQHAQLAFVVTVASGTLIRVIVSVSRSNLSPAATITLSASNSESNTFELFAGQARADLWVDCRAPHDRRVLLSLRVTATSPGRLDGAGELVLGGVIYGPRRTLKDRLTLMEAVRYAEPSLSETALRDASRRSMSFVIAGHMSGSYSLAQMNRRLALALEDLRPDSVRIEQVEGKPVRELMDVPAGEAARLMPLAMRSPPDQGPEVAIVQHWPIWSRLTESDLSLAFVHWEESLLPAPLVAQLNNDFDGVLAPTRSVAKSLTDSGVARPVIVVGDGPDIGELLVVGARRTATPSTGTPTEARPFTLLHVSSCFPRKGVDVLLRAYVAAFRRNDPVRLLIKGFPNPHNDVGDQIARLLADDPDAPEIVFINEDLPHEELMSLFSEADVVVLPSRGEGFNLPALEALAAGIPVIATGFGGHMDFLDDEIARLVDYRFAPSESHVASPGSIWVEPDPVDLASALREVFDRFSDKGAPGQSDAVHRIAWERARNIGDAAGWAKRVREASVDLLASPAVGSPKVAWVSSWGVRCGIAEYSSALLEHYPDANTDVTVLCDIRTPAQRAASRDGPEIRVAWEVWRSASIERLATEIDKLAADAVVIQHQPGLMTWSDLVELLRRPQLAGRQTIVELHTVNEFPPVDTDAGMELIAVLRQVSRLLVHTVRDLNVMKSNGLVDNVTLFPHGVPGASRLAPAPRRLDLTGAPLIGSYGFFLPPKGIDELIRALSIIRTRWKGAKLRLVNAEFPDVVSSEEIARCRALATQLGVFDAIEWQTGFLANEISQHLLSECDLVVLPYQGTKESASGAVRVALAAGAPVAVTPIPIFDDVRPATSTFDGLDAGSIAAGIEALLANPADRRAIQERAITWAGQYAWPTLAQRMAGMITGLVATAAAPSRPKGTVMPGGWESAASEPTVHHNTVDHNMVDEGRQAIPVQEMAVDPWPGSASEPT
jgi:glycosyltransferase involved in cell wall biosynthesis